MESNKEYAPGQGVALFTEQDSVDLSEDTFITKGLFVGDMGVARLFGDRDAIELKEGQQGLVFRNGKLENITAEEIEANALYELGVVLIGMRDQSSSLLCQLQLPDEQQTVIASQMTFDEDPLEENSLNRFYYNTTLWQLGGESQERFLLFDPGNEDILRQLRFSFSMGERVSQK